MTSIIKWITILCCLCNFFSSKAIGCQYNVRDVGFVDLISNPYRIYHFINNETSPEIVASLEQISYTSLLESNIQYEIVNIDQKMDHPAMEYFKFWEIQSIPASIMISPDGRSLVLPLSNPDESFRETLWKTLDNVVSSPVREKILKNIIKAYCIVLLIEGRDDVDNKHAREIADEAAVHINQIMSQLPKRIEEPPHVIVIPQEQFAQERILLWSLDINEQEIDEPHVSIIYGKGRRFGPLLKGAQRIQKELSSMLSIIGLSCECGLDKRWMTGSPIPLRWEEKKQLEVVQTLGFDAESPVVKMEISSILSFDASRIRSRSGNEGNIYGYGEGIIRREAESSSKRLSPAQMNALISQSAPAAKTAEDEKSDNEADRINAEDSSRFTPYEGESETVINHTVQNLVPDLQEASSAGISTNMKHSLYLIGIVILFIIAGGLTLILRARRRMT